MRAKHTDNLSGTINYMLLQVFSSTAGQLTGGNGVQLAEGIGVQLAEGIGVQLAEGTGCS